VRAAFRLAWAIAVIWITAGLAATANAEPLRIGHSTYVGYGPLFVAQEKGFFTKQGADVDMITIEDVHARIAALEAGQIDAIAVTADTMVRFLNPDGELYRCMLVLSDSLGADGIVASKDIQSIADLEGKVVAFEEGEVSQFYLNVLLKEAGLSQENIEVVGLTAEDASNAFLLQEVDAAVTWEPWLTEAKQAEHGHLLTDSSDRPGLIIDVVFTTPSVLDARRGEFAALAHAWFEAVDYVQANPDEAREIMARGVGGWLEDPAAFAEALAGVRFYDSDRMQEYFGTADQPGPIYPTLQAAIDVWSDLGILEVEVSPADLVARGVWTD
jgi:NitT/TauT family transport system substrate-binding protein